MFGRRVFGGTPDSFHLTLDFGPASAFDPAAPGQQVRLAVIAARLEFEWTSDEAGDAIVQRFIQRKEAALQARACRRTAAAHRRPPLQWEGSRSDGQPVSAALRAAALSHMQQRRRLPPSASAGGY